MKKIILLILAITFPAFCFSAEIAIPNTFSNGQVADANEINANFSALESGVNRKQDQHAGAIYRWTSFHTYSQATGWKMNNDASMFGGIAPNVWTDGNGIVGDMSASKDVLRTLFTRKGYGGKNAVILSDEWYSYSSTNGQMALALFRVKNTTGGDIQWTPSFFYTSYSAWSEKASLALNGVNIWQSTGSCGPCTTPTNVLLTIPANRTSTVIVGSASSPASTTRATVLAFTNNSLDLPAGLEYVDDFDTAVGGWEQ